ncbi:O-antigen ligase family protein [Roseateles sp.]|uniref:O-antigen ligase family protein n=1 Tax=Roseateles sp. TaxID=1971397 RepID=UPI003BA695F9
MSSAELIGVAYYGAFAFGTAALLILVQGGFLSLESRFARWTLPAVPVFLCLGIALSTLLSGRNLKYASFDIRTIEGTGGDGGGHVTRALTGLVLAICFAKILTCLMNSRARRAAPAGGQGLFVALLAFFAATHVLAAALGAYPTFVHNSYYPIVMFIAFFLARGEGLEASLHALKCALLGLMVGSLVAALLLPSLAIQPDYPGWIPGFTIRLWGLGSNANSIGPLALLLGLLTYQRPFRRSWMNVLAGVAVLTVFVLAQSKTVWASGLVCVVVLMLYGRGRDAQGRLKPGFVLGLLALALVAMGALMVLDLGRIASKIVDSKAGGEIATLTGRTAIWAEAWRLWLDNLWFGYGPEAWGPVHRFRIGMPFAFHAHNQLMQSLSVAGLFGGLALLAYLACLLLASWRAAAQTRGVSLALAVAVLARCVSEAPLELEGLFVGETLIHLAWFAMVLLPYRRGEGAEATPFGHAAPASALSRLPQVRAR